MPRYRESYGLSGRPFGKSPNLGRPYIYTQLEELVDYLETLTDDGGLGMVTGEIGSGKTTAVRHFLSALDQNSHHLCYVGNTRHPRGILRALVESFGNSAPHLRCDMLSMAGRLIARTFLEGRRRTIFVLDEAHLVEDSLLEDLRLLSNFEMDSQDPLALILVGHPALRARLRQPVHAALADQVSIHYRLEGLSLAETLHYLDEHMQQAGAPAGVFSPEAGKIIFELAQGIPRKINRLAINCLVKGAGKKTNPITAEHVNQVAKAIELL